VGEDIPAHLGEDAGLYALQYHTVCTLDLPICAMVSDCHLIYSDVVIVTEVQELLSSELGAVIGDASIGDGWRT
jgi:hypothetical protein